MKLLVTAVLLLGLLILAGGAWFVLSGRADQLARVHRRLRMARERPGAKEVAAMPGCAMGAVFDTREFWIGSSDLQKRHPRVEALPSTLVLCGVRKHANPPRTDDVAHVYGGANGSHASFVVVVYRQRLGESLFEADTFPASEAADASGPSSR